MSLLDEAMENCVMIDKRTVSDGYGGVDTSYVDGAPFICATTLDTSTQARVAQQQGVSVNNLVAQCCAYALAHLAEPPKGEWRDGSITYKHVGKKRAFRLSFCF